jgi:A/G-specific adenine glycosylase
MDSGAAVDISEKIKLFQAGILLDWHDHGRKALPWRTTADPWKLLMAEILLRKTTSSQASLVFEQLQNYSPSDIANMSLDMLENILKPIGLYKVRAEGLKDIAQTVANTDIEQFKSDMFLRSMPGVGRYISNSVRCCAFGVPVPALDTNMIRVVQRVFGWKSSRKRLREDSKLWSFTETLVPSYNAREFNWGILDFGAAVCTARKPKCPICPLQEICDYYKNQTQTQAI